MRQRPPLGNEIFTPNRVILPIAQRPSSCQNTAMKSCRPFLFASLAALAIPLMAQEEEMRDYFNAPFVPQQIGAAPPRKVELAGPVAAPPPAYVEGCADCHGATGEGDSGPHLIGVIGQPRRAKNDLLKILVNAREYGLKKPMPRSFPEIPEADKQKIVEWLETLKAKSN